ncbi:MAG: flagellar protein export ATPase FliI [Candidatus Eisenbacteria bacterium]|nr:flagellar protein export ATPase FliI [Candidatus Eisenbacteria bacterium]
MSAPTLKAEKYLDVVERIDPVRRTGRVSEIIGLVIESRGPAVSIGDVCVIEGLSENRSVRAEVVGFRDDHVLLMPVGEISGVAAGSAVAACGQPMRVPVGHELLGRVLDGLGNPIDGGGPTGAKKNRPLLAPPPNPLTRQRIAEPLATGIRSIDGLVTCGKGQRVGIFSGSGVGKSVVLGMIARNCEADLNVIALIGERGREVRDFIEKDLGKEGLRKSVVVAVTSDQAALIRLKGAMLATTVAEYFRELGLNVMLMMDSLTRVAMAQREIGLAVGEPPTTKGYPPSVFALLPRLLERSGTAAVGSITGLYTVLVEGDDMNDPVADAARSILDGHIALSRKLATENHYPAVDVLESVSRVMIDVVDPEHQEQAARVREVLATYREAEDLINIGAYVKKSNPRIDFAIERIETIRSFLRQGMRERTEFADTSSALKRLLN